MKVNCGLSNKVIADLVGNDFSRVVGVGVEGGGLTGNYLKEKTEKNLKKVLRKFYFKEMLRNRAIERKFDQEKASFFIFFTKMREYKSMFVS